jgi:hypothetical protein
LGIGQKGAVEGNLQHRPSLGRPGQLGVYDLVVVGHFLVLALSLGKDIGADQEVRTAKERGRGCPGRLGLKHPLNDDGGPTAQGITGGLYGLSVGRSWDLDHVKSFETESVQDIPFVLLTPPDQFFEAEIVGLGWL